ncbi:MAG: sulfatase [Bacteroidota bacterium]
MKHLWLVLAVICTSLLCFAQEPDRPNILWIISDDLSPDLGCYGSTDVNTPNIDKLAGQGTRYAKAFANAPVCSSSRSSLITGLYPTAINSLEHRTIDKRPLPKGIRTIVSLMQAAGYFCTNGNGLDLSRSGKEDYNFSTEVRYDGTDWREAGDQPFFAQVQIKYPHRPFAMDSLTPINDRTIGRAPCYPDHPLIQADWARYLESVQMLDQTVGEILSRLEEDGLTEKTVVMFFGDHGRPHLRDKQFLYDGGLRVPLVIRGLEAQSPKIEDRLVSLVDIAATTLHLAHIDVPAYFHGVSFLEESQRTHVFGFRGRAGDAVDDIRSVSDGRYRLIWNQRTHIPYMQLSTYKKTMYPAYSLYWYLDSLGQVPPPYNQFMASTRPVYELYDSNTDPCEYRNLAGSKDHRRIEQELKSALQLGLKSFEYNNTAEAPETIAQAKASAERYGRQKTEDRGIRVDASWSDWVEYWYQHYGIEP